MGTGPIATEVEHHDTRLAPSWLKSYGPAALVTAVFVVLATRIFWLISRYAVNIFFWDEWDLKNATLFENHSFWQIFFWQFGWHRLGLGGWFEKLVDPLVRWNSRSESFLLGGTLTTAALCALLLKRRLHGSLSVFDVVIPAILFTPTQWEVLYGTPIFSQGPLPVLLILLYCMAWTSKKNVVRYPLILLINFLAIYTGFGFFLGMITPALLFLDYFSRVPSDRLPTTYFLGAVIVALASIGSLFIGYKPTSGIDCFSFQPRSVHGYVVFMSLMWAHFFALHRTTTFPRIVGKAFLIFLLVALAYEVWILLRRRASELPPAERTRWLTAAALISLSLLSCVTIAYFRLCGGYASAMAPRYAVYIQIGTLGLYFHLLSLHRSEMRKWLLSAFALPVLVACVHVDGATMSHWQNIKQRWRTCYLQTEKFDECKQVAGFPVYPVPKATHMREKMEYLKKNRLNLYSDSK